MLEGRRRLSEPAVIRDENEQLGTLFHESSHKVGKDALVADRCRNPMAVERADRVFGARREVSNLFCETLGKKQQSLQRNVFAEWHEMHLVVSRNDIALRAEQGRTVGRILTKHVDV